MTGESPVPITLAGWSQVGYSPFPPAVAATLGCGICESHSSAYTAHVELLLFWGPNAIKGEQEWAGKKERNERGP